MAKKTGKPEKTVADVAREVGRYPLAAYEFLHAGLDYTVRKIHGTPLPGLRQVLEWMEARGLDLSDLVEITAQGKLPAAIAAFLRSCDGLEGALQRLNRHISGQDLCHGLRELAIQRWGFMAPVVLRHWGIRGTRDFGEMVFALVNNGLLKKQPEDCIEDFDDVYDFHAAFTRSFRIQLGGEPTAEAGGE